MGLATGEFNVTGWNEEPFVERERGNLTRASVKQELSGGIEGTTTIEWLLAYREDKTADFVGIQEIEGELDGRSGSFVISSAGTFDGERATGRWAIVAGSGAGELAGISGDGEFDAPHGAQATYRLSYELG
ncbi:MAG: DUF3224 domain-containing protein [Actinomycetota bacterium]